MKDLSGNALTDVIATAAGDNHTMFLKSDGPVRASGHNGYRQLGDIGNVNRRNPVQMSVSGP